MVKISIPLTSTIKHQLSQLKITRPKNYTWYGMSSPRQHSSSLGKVPSNSSMKANKFMPFFKVMMAAATAVPATVWKSLMRCCLMVLPRICLLACCLQWVQAITMEAAAARVAWLRAPASDSDLTKSRSSSRGPPTRSPSSYSLWGLQPASAIYVSAAWKLPGYLPHTSQESSAYMMVSALTQLISSFRRW